MQTQLLREIMYRFSKLTISYIYQPFSVIHRRQHFASRRVFGGCIPGRTLGRQGFISKLVPQPQLLVAAGFPTILN